MKFSEKLISYISDAFSGVNDVLKEYLSRISNSETKIAELEGLSLFADQAAQEIKIKNNSGTVLSTISVAFLNNEGTTFFYNETTEKLELKNDAGEVLSEIPVSAFVSNLAKSISLYGSSFQLKDTEGNVLSSVTFQISNINGLQAALDLKADKTDSRFHTHANKSTLDVINNAKVQEWDGKATQQDIDDSIDAVEIGGRNYFSPNQISDFAITGGSQIDQEVYYRSFVMNVEDFESISISRFSVNTNRFRFGFSNVSIANGVQIFGYQVHDGNTRVENIQVPSNAIYFILYLSNGAEDITDSLGIKVEKGNKATDWTPNPDDTKTEIAKKENLPFSNSQQDTVSDLDNLLAPGNYLKLLGSTNPNLPETGFYYLTNYKYADTRVTQILIPYNQTYSLWMRHYQSSSFSEWRKVYDTSKDLELAKANPLLLLRENTVNQVESGRIRFCETEGSWQGAFIHYDGLNNIFNFGTNPTSSQDSNDDVVAFSIDRGSENVKFKGNIRIAGYTLDGSFIRQWNSAFQKKINALSVTGDSNKTITITREDGTTITASFLDDTNPAMPDDVINTLGFNENNNGVLRAVTSEGEIITVSLDGRYSLLGHTHSFGDIPGLSQFVNNTNNALTDLAKKNRTVKIHATNSVYTVSQSDEVVFFTHPSYHAINGTTPEDPGKPFWLIAYTPKSFSPTYIDSRGVTTSKIFGAVQLVYDGDNFREVNNRTTERYYKMLEPGLIPIDRDLIRYTGTSNETIQLPDANTCPECSFTIIFQNSARLNQTYIDTDGSTRATEESKTAGEVLKLYSDGINWMKIN